MIANIRGEILKVSPKENGRQASIITVMVQRGYERNGETIGKHPMVINAVTTSPPIGMEKGTNIDISGEVTPVNYVWTPNPENIMGTQTIIPEPREPNGLERSWEIKESQLWSPNYCYVSSFQVNITSLQNNGRANNNLITADIKLPKETVPVNQFLKDNIGMKTENANGGQLRRHSIRVEAKGRIYPKPQQHRNGTYSNLQFEVERKTKDGKTLQPIRIYGIAWDNLSDMIEAGDPRQEVEIKGFLEPWWNIWGPNGTRDGQTYTISERPGTDNYIEDPMELYDPKKWHPLCHMWQTFQITLDEVDGQRRIRKQSHPNTQSNNNLSSLFEDASNTEVKTEESPEEPPTE